MVVLIHTPITIEGDKFQITFSHVLSQVAVPAFFFFSGFLFFYNISIFTRKEYKTKIHRRIYTLAIPYIIWISLYILFKLFLLLKNKENVLLFFNIENWYDWISLYWDNAMIMECNVNWLGYSAYMTAPYLVPLWYLRDLIVVSLITPIIYFLIKRFKILFILFLFLAYTTHIWPIHTGLTIVSLFFFSWGSYYSINRIDFIYQFKKYEKIVYCLFGISVVFMIFYDGSHTSIGFLIHPFYVVVELICLNCFSLRMFINKTNINTKLEKSSFFIFVSHAIVIPYMALLLDIILPSHNFLISQLKYILIPMMTVGFCFITWLIIERIGGRFVKILFGNR